jgi:flagellar protein FliS
MDPTKIFKNYEHTGISTSSQGKLILLMYEGATKFTKMAMNCMDNGDIAGKGKYINKANNIINELSISLDMQKGGEVSTRLESLYQFMLNQLTLANIKSERKALESVLRVLLPLQDAWEQLYRPSSDNSVSPESIPPKGVSSKC